MSVEEMQERINELEQREQELSDMVDEYVVMVDERDSEIRTLTEALRSAQGMADSLERFLSSAA